MVDNRRLSKWCETDAARVSIIAHSCGTLAAGRFAGAYPDLVDRLVLFGPIGCREGLASPDPQTPLDYVTVNDQHARFVKTVPKTSPRC